MSVEVTVRGCTERGSAEFIGVFGAVAIIDGSRLGSGSSTLIGAGGCGTGSGASRAGSAGAGRTGGRAWPGNSGCSAGVFAGEVAAKLGS